MGLVSALLYGLLLTSIARVQSCFTFVGIYTAVPAGCTYTDTTGTFNDGTSYLSIVIAFDNSSKRLGITYCRDADDCYSENYIADGHERAENGVSTGKRYAISCLKDEILAMRVGMFSEPLISTFAFSPEGFVVNDRFE